VDEGGYKVKSWSNYNEAKKYHGARQTALRLRKSPCRGCGLYGCVCQISLKEFTDTETKLNTFSLSKLEIKKLTDKPLKKDAELRLIEDDFTII